MPPISSFVLLLCAVSVHEPHPCTLPNATHACRCTSLWESDCYCRSPNASVAMPPTGDWCSHVICEDLQKECWNYSNTYEKANFTDCPRPFLERVSVTIITMSKSLEGMLTLAAFKSVLEIFAREISFSLLYSVQSYRGNLTSYHGPDEVMGDLWSVCTMHYYPDVEDYYPFLMCLQRVFERQLSPYPHVMEPCALSHGLNFSTIFKCVADGQGKDLLWRSSTSASKKIPSSWSNEPVVIMDGRLYNPHAGRDTDNFLAGLCYVFHHPSSEMTFPWWIFVFLFAIALTVLVLFWIVRGGSKFVARLLCSLFYELPASDGLSGNHAEEALRRWQLGDFESSAESESSEETPQRPPPSDIILDSLSDSSSEDVNDRWKVPALFKSTDTLL